MMIVASLFTSKAAGGGNALEGEEGEGVRVSRIPVNAVLKRLTPSVAVGAL